MSSERNTGRVNKKYFLLVQSAAHLHLYYNKKFYSNTRSVSKQIQKILFWKWLMSKNAEFGLFSIGSLRRRRTQQFKILETYDCFWVLTKFYQLFMLKWELSVIYLLSKLHDKNCMSMSVLRSLFNWITFELLSQIKRINFIMHPCYQKCSDCVNWTYESSKSNSSSS